jgi:branched-chain amino acid transport system permease protein
MNSNAHGRARSTSTRPVLTSMTNPGAVMLAIAAVLWISLAPDYMIFTASAAIPIAVAALGLLVLQGWARELSLASAGLFATALYYYGWFVRDNAEGLGIPWMAAAVMAVAISTGLMAALAAGSSKLPGIYLVVITLGLQITIEKFVYTNDVLTGGITGGTRSGDSILNPRPYFFGLNLRSDTTFYLFLLGWLAVVLVLVVRLRHSPAGLAFLLVGSDRQAASAVGISPLRFRVQAFATSGLLAGVGGVLGAWLFMNPPIFLNYGAGTSMLLLAIPVLAGADSIAVVLVVATAFQVIPVALESWHIDSFLLAGVGLGLGAAAGSRRTGGRARDMYLSLRHGDRQTRTAHVTDTAMLRAPAGLADDRGSDMVLMAAARPVAAYGAASALSSTSEGPSDELRPRRPRYSRDSK